MVACYSMVAAVLVKKPVMVGKGAVGDDVVEWDGIIGCRAELAGLERRSFLDGVDGSTNFTDHSLLMRSLENRYLQDI